MQRESRDTECAWASEWVPFRCCEGGRDSERNTNHVSFQVCEYVSIWRQNKRAPLSCMALKNLYGFRTPSARVGGGGSLWLSLKLPVCLFPHHQLAKQQDPPPLPRVRSLSTPVVFDLTDRRRGSERALGTISSVYVCDGVVDWKPGGWLGSGGVKDRCPSPLSSCLLAVDCSRTHSSAQTNTCLQICKDKQVFLINKFYNFLDSCWKP